MKKYAIDTDATKDGKLMENDIVLFRYADVLLMKSEAKVRNGKRGCGIGAGTQPSGSCCASGNIGICWTKDYWSLHGKDGGRILCVSDDLPVRTATIRNWRARRVIHHRVSYSGQCAENE